MWWILPYLLITMFVNLPELMFSTSKKYQINIYYFDCFRLSYPISFKFDVHLWNYYIVPISLNFPITLLGDKSSRKLKGQPRIDNTDIIGDTRHKQHKKHNITQNIKRLATRSPPINRSWTQVFIFTKDVVVWRYILHLY